MKEAKSEAEKIIANYRAEMEATYQVALAKVHFISLNYRCKLSAYILLNVTVSIRTIFLFHLTLFVFGFSFCRVFLRATAPAARPAMNWKHPPTVASKTCSKSTFNILSFVLILHIFLCWCQVYLPQFTNMTFFMFTLVVLLLMCRFTFLFFSR